MWYYKRDLRDHTETGRWTPQFSKEHQVIRCCVTDGTTEEFSGKCVIVYRLKSNLEFGVKQLLDVSQSRLKANAFVNCWIYIVFFCLIAIWILTKYKVLIHFHISSTHKIVFGLSVCNLCISLFFLIFNIFHAAFILFST